MGRAHLRNLIYFHEVDKGEHFAAWEQAELFAAEVGAAFRSLRSQVPGRRAPDRSPSQMAMRQLIWKE